MNNLRFLYIILIYVGTLIFPIQLSGVKKYKVFVQQPDLVKPPVIKWVTVNDYKKINIAWEKQVNDNIDYYKVYRSLENSESNWELAGSVDYHSDSYLNDLNSYASIQSYKYRISAVDKCGNETYSKTIFRTIYLHLKETIDGRHTIEWNPYEGMNVTIYLIYNGSTSKNLSLIDSVGATRTSYDINISQDITNYRVEARGFVLDTLSNQTNKMNIVNSTSDYVYSFSNITTYNYDSILNHFDNENLQIYPNILKTESEIKFPFDPNQHYQLYIFDMLGNIVYKQSVLSGEFIIKNKNFKDGMYFLQIVGKKRIQKKLIVVG